MADVSWWQALVLGIVQGATEWLPVSSSGHLVLTEALLGVDAPTGFALVLHLGTLLAVLVAYWPRLWGMLMALRPGGNEGERRMAGLLVLATLPIVIVGLVFESTIFAAFESLIATGAGLILTAAILYSTRWARVKPGPMSVRQAVLTGCAQALAVLPGVSRSGSTLAGGMHAGLERKDAADFGFMLAIPALVGATVFLARDLQALEVGWTVSLLGLVVSFLVGLATLRWLLGFVRARGVAVFAPYCLVIGLVTIAFAVL